MRNNSNDRTLERNHIQKYRFLIREYEQVKAKRHHQFRFLQDFYTYGVRFEAILTDNGSETFARSTNKTATARSSGCCKSWASGTCYTRPYRPQTNGKIERFRWTLNEDLPHHPTFESVEELKEELVEYMLYYNTERPHQGINGKSPLRAMELLSTN